MSVLRSLAAQAAPSKRPKKRNTYQGNPRSCPSMASDGTAAGPRDCIVLPTPSREPPRYGA